MVSTFSVAGETVPTTSIKSGERYFMVYNNITVDIRIPYTKEFFVFVTMIRFGLCFY